MDESLAKLKDRQPNSRIIVGGDFNVPGICWESLSHIPGTPHKQHCELILDVSDQYSLDQMVREPTRGSNILDLAFSNSPDLTKSCSTIPGISDHDHAVLMEVDLEAQRNKKASRTVPLYNKANWDKIRDDMETYEKEFFDTLPADHSVDENWESLKTKIMSTIAENVRTKLIGNRKDMPWMTRNLKRLINKKHRVYNKAKRSHKDRDWAQFRHLRKETGKQCQLAHWGYLNRILDPTEDKSSKGFWKYIKSKNTESCGVSPLKTQDGIVTSAQEKAKALNDQFCSVFSHEDQSAIPTLERPALPSMDDIKITRNGVKTLLDKIKSSKAGGPDKITARFIKETTSQISTVVAFIYQQSLDTGHVPKDWQLAYVTPVFKKGKRCEPANYRPISLTCLLCKGMEHIMVSSMMDHLPGGVLTLYFDTYAPFLEKKWTRVERRNGGPFGEKDS